LDLFSRFYINTLVFCEKSNSSDVPPFLRAPDVPPEQLKPRGSAAPAASGARLSATLRHVAHAPERHGEVMSRFTTNVTNVSEKIEEEPGGKIMAFDACKIFEERLSENGVEPPLLLRSQFHGFILIFTLSLLHTARIWKHKHFRFKSMACSARDIHH